MRGLFVMGAVLLVSACSMAPQPAPIVSWQYGTGNGDGVAYPGPAPTYARAYGLGAGDGVQSGQTANTTYAYGADGVNGTMIQLTPDQARTQVAAPTSNTPAQATGVGSHI